MKGEKSLALTAESSVCLCQEARGLCVERLKSLCWKPEKTEDQCRKTVVKTGPPPKKKQEDFLLLSMVMLSKLQAYLFVHPHEGHLFSVFGICVNHPDTPRALLLCQVVLTQVDKL